MSDIPVPGQQKLTFRIKRIAISIDLSHKVYGTGPDSYCSLSADVDSATLDRLPDVVDGGLDLFIHCWKVIVAGQLAAKLTAQSSQDFTAMLQTVEKRLARIRVMLREEPPQIEAVPPHEASDKCPVCSHRNDDDEHCGGPWHQQE